jgi:hypothetical protein
MADPPITLSRIEDDSQFESSNPKPIFPDSVQQDEAQAITAGPDAPDSIPRQFVNRPRPDWPAGFGYQRPAPGQVAGPDQPASTAMSFPRPLPKFIQDTMFGSRMGTSPYQQGEHRGSPVFGFGSPGGGAGGKSGDKSGTKGSTSQVFTGTATKLPPPLLIHILCGLLSVAANGFRL